MSWLDRRRSEPRAPEPEQKLAIFRDLIETHPAALLVTNDAGEVIAASARFRAFFVDSPLYQAPAPASGEGIKLDPAVWAGDPERFRRRIAQIVAAGSAISSEEVALADGRAFERDYASLELGGQRAHVWEYRDVTDRYNAERARREAASRLQFLVNVGSAALYSSRPSADYDRTFVSENIGEMLGYEPSRWTEPGFWRRALHPDDAARVILEMPRLRERGQLVVEYRLRHEDGRTVRVRDEMRLICETEGHAVEIVGWLTDITAQRRAENDLSTLGRAAAEVVHDFSNLLLVIAGHAQLLKGALPEGDTLRWHANEIANASERAAVLTDRIRTVGKLRVPEVRPETPIVLRRGTGETILLVEDEDAVRIFTGKALTGNGYKVLEARRGEEALEIASQNVGSIAAVITDLSMPGMSGYELAKRLAAAQPRIKVIVMSGYDPEELQIASDASASPLTFLSKPFTPDVLATRLRQMLDN